MIEKAPPAEATTKPAPSHCGQTCGLVPGLPPVPLQSGQAESEVSRSETVTPSMASVKLIVAVVSTSAPFCGAAASAASAAAAEEVAEHVAEPAARHRRAGPVAEQVVEVEAATAAGPPPPKPARKPPEP